jgi:hypothetical protein
VQGFRVNRSTSVMLLGDVGLEMEIFCRSEDGEFAIGAGL